MASRWALAFYSGFCKETTGTNVMSVKVSRTSLKKRHDLRGLAQKQGDHYTVVTFKGVVVAFKDLHISILTLLCPR